MSTSWTLAIDFGTSFSAAAISDGGAVELVEVEDGRRFPSGVLLGEDGTLLVGRVASNQARRAPERFERTPKRLVGQPAVLLGGQAVEVADLVAAVLRRVGEAAIQRQGGSRPAALVLTCPAEWGPERRAQRPRAVDHEWFRSDAEQARLFRANPNPKWVPRRARGCTAWALSSTYGHPAPTPGSPRRPQIRLHPKRWEDWHWGCH